jgi:hypothetical protein
MSDSSNRYMGRLAHAIPELHSLRLLLFEFRNLPNEPIARRASSSSECKSKITKRTQCPRPLSFFIHFRVETNGHMECPFQFYQTNPLHLDRRFRDLRSQIVPERRIAVAAKRSQTGPRNQTLGTELKNYQTNPLCALLTHSRFTHRPLVRWGCLPVLPTGRWRSHRSARAWFSVCTRTKRSCV